jgi:tRNA threonylcarbamoyladenosine biosynthesis protein TsaE
MRTKKGPASGRARVVVTRSEAETFRLARNLARKFRGGEVVLLIGELGAGKTIFAKGIAAGLGLKGPGPVCSPSFTLLNVYQAKFPIFHFDLYRLEKGAEVEELGLEDCLDRGVVIVEWAEKIPFALKAIRVDIEKAKNDDRIIKISMI